MAIKRHPPIGSILICDFDKSFKAPEMVKRRPVVVVSPQITSRKGLCTVVALSTTPPDPIMPYHASLMIHPSLPSGYQSSVWVKGDMIYAVGLHRLNFIRVGKDRAGKRIYYQDLLDREQMKAIYSCILGGLGLVSLTNHL